MRNSGVVINILSFCLFQGDLILPLPSIEVLADAASNTDRHGSVLHVLETTIIGWIKQIKVRASVSIQYEIHGTHVIGNVI